MLAPMAIYTAVVAAPAAYPAANAPSFVIPFQPKRVTFINEDATLANAVDVSADGMNDATRLTPTIPNSAVQTLNQTNSNWWVKRAAGTPNVRIVAED